MRRMVIRAIPVVVKYCLKLIPEQGTFKDFSLTLDIPAQPYHGRIQVAPYRQEESAVQLAIYPIEYPFSQISHLMFLGTQQEIYEWFEKPERIEKMTREFAQLVIVADKNTAKI